MPYVQLFFVTMIFILGDFSTVETTSLTAEEGHKLNIQCSHSNAIGNIKFFCKDPCDYQDVLIKSNKIDPNNKYSLRDTGNTFFVTISDLTMTDSGVHWCGVERVGLDTYNRVVITVKQRTVEESHASPHQVSSTKKLLCIGTALGVLVLILAILVVIFIKSRHRDKHSKPTEDEPLKSKQKSSQDATISCSSANQSSELDLETIQPERDMRLESTGDIYANINQREINMQPDNVCYSSVRFNQPCPTAKNTSVKHTAHESSVYSEVMT